MSSLIVNLKWEVIWTFHCDIHLDITEWCKITNKSDTQSECPCSCNGNTCYYKTSWLNVFGSISDTAHIFVSQNFWFFFFFFICYYLFFFRFFLRLLYFDVRIAIKDSSNKLHLTQGKPKYKKAMQSLIFHPCSLLWRYLTLSPLPFSQKKLQRKR